MKIILKLTKIVVVHDNETFKMQIQYKKQLYFKFLNLRTCLQIEHLYSNFYLQLHV